MGGSQGYKGCNRKEVISPGQVLGLGSKWYCEEDTVGPFVLALEFPQVMRTVSGQIQRGGYGGTRKNAPSRRGEELRPQNITKPLPDPASLPPLPLRQMLCQFPLALPTEGLLSRACRRARQSQLSPLKAMSSWPWSAGTAQPGLELAPCLPDLVLP